MAISVIAAQLVCGFLAWLVAAGAVSAQTFTAGVRGTVQELSGAVIPGVAVQLVNDGTNASREIVSNERGEYSFSAVPPGTYTVRASLPGFKAFERPAIRVATQQFITLDIVLEVGNLQETITVRAQRRCSRRRMPRSARYCRRKTSIRCPRWRATRT